MQEDLFVARVDGTQYRRLTDDAFRDRGPAWAPDGARIAFYSDRAGGYEAWMIRPDGSGLQRLTDSVGGMNLPTFSPDGTRLSTWSVTDPWWQIVDATHGATRPAAERSPRSMAAPPSGRCPGHLTVVVCWAWERIKTARLRASRSTTSPVVRFTTLSSESSVWTSPIWLPDSQRFLMRNAGGIWLVNPARNTGASRSAGIWWGGASASRRTAG